MSDFDRQHELYNRMVALHRDMLAVIRDYEQWSSPGEIADLQVACLEFGRIALKFGVEIME